MQRPSMHSEQPHKWNVETSFAEEKGNKLPHSKRASWLY